MNRDKLEKYLHKKVRVTLFNDKIYEGRLRKSEEEDFKNNENIYLSPDYYFLTDDMNNCISCLFRTSHIKKIKGEKKK